MNLCECIRKTRKEKGMTLKQLANKVGVSEQAISHYERGDRQIKTEILVKIATALEVDINDLLGSNKEEMLKNFKEISKITIIDQEIETLNHIEEILKINEAIGYENCFKYFNLLTLEEKLHFVQDFRKYISQQLKTYIYLNHKYEILSSNEKSQFETFNSDTIEAIKQELTSKKFI